MIERREAQAFKVEFYERAKREQIREDLVSYLGEYRFEVPEFTYEMNIRGGKLTDPTSGELMTSKAKKAIEDRRKDRLNISRETAELSGLLSLESQLKENPKGTVVWFSPPGEKNEGYGDYGFGYTGKVEDDKLKMTAIRLESPQILDFNRASLALFSKEFEKAEDFLSSPMVLDIEEGMVKDFIQGNFNIKENTGVFDKSLKSMRNVISDCVDIIQYGSQEQKHMAMHVIENISLEIKALYENEGRVNENIDYIPLSLTLAMKSRIYTLPPPRVQGSCGATSVPQTNEIFKSLNYKKIDKKQRSFDFDEPGPCRLCGSDAPCGPCKICMSCNDKLDASEMSR